MKIELENIKLTSRSVNIQSGASRETRSVYNIKTTEKRTLVEHKIPGLEGNIFQDMGREPIRISFDGIFQGPLAKKNLEELRKKFKAGKPVQFASDITGTTDITKVLINDLIIGDTLGDSARFTYSISLIEYLEAKASSGTGRQETPVHSQEKQAEDSVSKVINQVKEAKKQLKEVQKKAGKTKKEVSNKIKKIF